MKRLLFFCFAAMMMPWTAHAHEVRPALLQMEQQAGGTYDILWKQPVTDGKRLRLKPILPDQCQQTQPPEEIRSSISVATRWQVRCALTTGTIAVEGLERSLTDVFVRIENIDGTSRSHVLRPDAIRWDLAAEESALLSLSTYLGIGIEHLLFGYDHLLFVLGLTLLIARRQIIAVVTSFTVAHSLTLALTVFDVIRIPIAPVELLIAASIVLLAYENSLKWRGQSTLAQQKPWLIAFAVGLIHGLGFAGALSEIGLPAGEEAWALLLFNLGLEIGQLMFVAVIVALLALIGKYWSGAVVPIERLCVYIVGAMGSYWFMDRLIG